jgi:hypothetical protein
VKTIDGSDTPTAAIWATRVRPRERQSRLGIYRPSAVREEATTVSFIAIVIRPTIGGWEVLREETRVAIYPTQRAALAAVEGLRDEARATGDRVTVVIRGRE